MHEIATTQAGVNPACSGNCIGCGKVHIRIFENHSLQAWELNQHLNTALQVLEIPHKIISAAAPEDARIFGVTQFPALMLEQDIVCEGYVPSLEQVTLWLMERFTHHLKLHRMKRLTVPVDLSEQSGNSLRFARELARQTGSSIEIVHVMDSIFEGSKASSTGFLSGYGKTMQSEVESFTKSVLSAEGAEDTLPEITTKVLFGFPDAVLTAYSAECDLMIIGSTGRSGLNKRLLGSISAEVSRAAHCPVLLVPQNAEFHGFKDIIYTSDFESLHPLQVVKAVSFAERFGAGIRFVHAGPAQESNESALHTKFKAVLETLPEAYRYAPLIKLVSENVMESLYEFTASHKADLLVFVTHERRFWENLLHKSITAEALFDAKLPLLIIHAEEEE